MDAKALSSILHQHFKWNKARMDCFTMMLQALFKVRTVNLTSLALAFGGESKTESNYRRIRRFFKEFTMNFTVLASWIFKFFNLEKESIQLILDRTNWRWGKKDINLLVLSLTHKGIAIPLLWTLLPKKGNSDENERIEIIKLFMSNFKNKISCLFGDREFIGDKWFTWLTEQTIPYCIRLKKNFITQNSRGQEVRVDRLFLHLKIGETLTLQKPRVLWSQKVYISALKLETGELLILASNTVVVDPIKEYGKRWEIETLFSCLKSRGFNFEDTHIVAPERISKLMALLTVAFCIAHKIGEWKSVIKTIKIKKHARKSYSYFRYGLDLIREIVLNPLVKKSKVLEEKIFQILLGTDKQKNINLDLRMLL